jgi:acyl-CoA thioesterase FadM
MDFAGGGPGCGVNRATGAGASRSVGAVSGIATRFAVLVEVPVGPGDRTAGGGVDPAAVSRWIDAARQAYLDRCPALERARAAGGLTLTHRVTRQPDASLLGTPESVAVSASAAEFRPSSFTLSVRMRAVDTSDGDRDVALNATVTVSLTDPATGEPTELGTEIRDELIALEHAAQYFN